jgi:hypothetical protein
MKIRTLPCNILLGSYAHLVQAHIAFSLPKVRNFMQDSALTTAAVLDRESSEYLSDYRQSQRAAMSLLREGPPIEREYMVSL